MAKLVVLYDACVLYPASLRDLLMHLALTDLYRAKWSNQIHDEWIRNVLANRPELTLVQLERTRKMMDQNIFDPLVENYEYLTSSLMLPDPNDRHVLAAAIHSECSRIITYNLKDFPDRILKKYDINAQHPDNFIAYLIDLDPNAVCDAIKTLRTGLKKPPMNIDRYFEVLHKLSLTQTLKKLDSLRAAL